MFQIWAKNKKKSMLACSRSAQEGTEPSTYVLLLRLVYFSSKFQIFTLFFYHIRRMHEAFNVVKK
jgi:hypothetical protein